MATVLRVWRVDNEKLSELPELDPGEQGLLEKRLENWLASQPDAIQDDLLIIGRQVQTPSGPLDLLGITSEGKLVVVELKRGRAPRETVAQALDYASWIATQTPDEIRHVASNYLKRPVEEAFLEKFEQQLAELQPEAPSILVVASRLDTPTERMIQYLSQEYRMDIDGLVFRYVRLGDEEVLIRTTVVPEDSKVKAGGSSHVSIETLLTKARDHDTMGHLNVLRRLSEFLSEAAAPSYGGSFRYWGYGRMLCGVNVAAFWGATKGAIDVWVSHGSWAEGSGLAEESLVQELRSEFEFVKQYEKSRQLILRIKSTDEANKFVSVLRPWYEGHSDSPEDAAPDA